MSESVDTKLTGGTWAVARRVDWDEADRPYILFGGPGGLYTRQISHRSPERCPVFFKTQRSAQSRANRLNEKIWGERARRTEAA